MPPTSIDSDRTVRVRIAHLPPAVALISWPERQAGLAWLGGWPDRQSCLADLIRRGLAVHVESRT